MQTSPKSSNTVTIGCSSRQRVIATGSTCAARSPIVVRELTGGKSSVAFSYRIVGRRKDIKQQRRFAKIDMPLSLPTRPPRAPHKLVSTAADLHAFVARVEKEAPRAGV